MHRPSRQLIKVPVGDEVKDPASYLAEMTSRALASAAVRIPGSGASHIIAQPEAFQQPVP